LWQPLASINIIAYSKYIGDAAWEQHTIIMIAKENIDNAIVSYIL